MLRELGLIPGESNKKKSDVKESKKDKSSLTTSNRPSSTAFSAASLSNLSTSSSSNSSHEAATSSVSGSLESTSPSDAGPSLFPSSKLNTASSFHGVVLDSENSKKWRAFIDVPNQGYFNIGLFDSADAAAHAYDEVACRFQGAELNFKREVIGGGVDAAKRKPGEVGFVRSSSGQLKRTSKFFGVNFNKNKCLWEIRVKAPGGKAIRPSFVDEVEAAENYDILVSHNWVLKRTYAFDD